MSKLKGVRRGVAQRACWSGVRDRPKIYFGFMKAPSPFSQT